MSDGNDDNNKLKSLLLNSIQIIFYNHLNFLKMKNLVLSIVALMSFSFANTASANTFIHNTPPQYAADFGGEMAKKFKIKITISFKPLVVVIEASLRTAPGGNDNGTGDITANAVKPMAAGKGISEKGLRFSVTGDGQRLLAGTSEIVVTKGAVCPDGRVINVGDRIVFNGSEYVISPRDAASGLPSGK